MRTNDNEREVAKGDDVARRSEHARAVPANPLLKLQRQVGNRAVSALLAGRAPSSLGALAPALSNTAMQDLTELQSPAAPVQRVVNDDEQREDMTEQIAEDLHEPTQAELPASEQSGSRSGQELSVSRLSSPTRRLHEARARFATGNARRSRLRDTRMWGSERRSANRATARTERDSKTQAFRQWYSARARSGQSRGSRAEQRAQFEAWYARRQHGAQPSGAGITDESVEGVDTLFGESAEG